MDKTIWDERIATLSIHPDMANRDDIANLAADFMEERSARLAAEKEFAEAREIIEEALEPEDVRPDDWKIRARAWLDARKGGR